MRWLRAWLVWRRRWRLVAELEAAGEATPYALVERLAGERLQDGILARRSVERRLGRIVDPARYRP